MNQRSKSAFRHAEWDPVSVLGGVLLALLLSACSADKVVSTLQAAPDAGGGAVAKQPPAGDAGIANPSAPLKAVEYTEADFVENDRNRDPFRSYASTFAEQGKRPAVNQRNVMLGQYSVDELKLVAIVMSGDYPRAMLVDPAGKGWVVKKGDFIGRPDVVHTGGANGADYQLNWRVDRVRQGDLVLLREDPAQPAIAPATRVIPLHPEALEPTSQRTQ